MFADPENLPSIYGAVKSKYLQSKVIPMPQKQLVNFLKAFKVSPKKRHHNYVERFIDSLELDAGEESVIYAKTNIWVG